MLLLTTRCCSCSRSNPPTCSSHDDGPLGVLWTDPRLDLTHREMAVLQTARRMPPVQFPAHCPTPLDPLTRCPGIGWSSRERERARQRMRTSSVACKASRLCPVRSIGKQCRYKPFISAHGIPFVLLLQNAALLNKVSSSSVVSPTVCTGSLYRIQT